MLLPNTRKQRILFFIAGEMPTTEEAALAAALGTKAFRNASQVQAGEKPEDCHAVAGRIPAAYAKLPVAQLPAPVAAEQVVAIEPEAPVADVDSDIPVEQVEQAQVLSKKKRR